MNEFLGCVRGGEVEAVWFRYKKKVNVQKFYVETKISFDLLWIVEKNLLSLILPNYPNHFF